MLLGKSSMLLSVKYCKNNLVIWSHWVHLNRHSSWNSQFLPPLISPQSFAPRKKVWVRCCHELVSFHLHTPTLQSFSFSFTTYFLTTWNCRKVTFVGIHNRRTDHLKFAEKIAGVKPIKKSYFKDAMEYFRWGSYRAFTQNVLRARLGHLTTKNVLLSR